MKKKALKKRKVNKSAKKTITKRKPKKVLAIPTGYHSVTPYLVVNDCVKAIEFYKKALGAKEKLRIELPNNKIAHAELKIGDSIVMLADPCAEKDTHSPESFGGSPITIHLYVKDVDAVIERAIKLGAKLLRPIENMFYGDRCGGIEDPFGHKWFIATHVENVSPAQLKKRMAGIFGNNA